MRRHAACPLRLRDIEEMVAEHGVGVDYAIVNRLVIKILSMLALSGVLDKTQRANACAVAPLRL